MRRRDPQRSKLTVVLAVALGLLTPMAANMVGAQAGASAAGSSATPVVTVVAAVTPPRGFRLPASGVRPDPAGDRASGRPCRSMDQRPGRSTAHPSRVRPAPHRRRAGRRGALRLQVLRDPDRGLGRRGLLRRQVGTRRAPLHLAAARRVDPSPRSGTRRDPRAGRGRPVPAPGHGAEVRQGPVPRPRRDGRAVISHARRRVLRDRSRALLGRERPRILRVRDQRHPTAPAGRLVGWESARDPRHEQPLVDRTERERGLRPGLGDDARPAAPAARRTARP